ncbi:hypothetical protein [Mycolicibacterium sp. A43C]
MLKERVFLGVSAWLAVAFGALLAVLEIVRNWGHWQWWPFWVVDYVAASLLLCGGIAALTKRGAAWLAAGWGFTCALFWGSFFGHYENAREGIVTEPNEETLTVMIGIMFAITIGGLVVTLVGLRSIADTTHENY